MIINIIGTDTEIGKTYISCEILKHLNKQQLNVAGIKPIASGVTQIDGKYVNEDAYKLQQCSNNNLTIKQINPICFKEAIAPHIAAKLENHSMTVDSIIQINNAMLSDKSYDHIIIEGVGGLMTPLNQDQTYLELLEKWQHPVILVVGMKLGCLNHSLLTYNMLLQKNIPVLGFIINQISPDMPYQEQNMEYLTQKLQIPLLGKCKYGNNLELNQYFKDIFKC